MNDQRYRSWAKRSKAHRRPSTVVSLLLLASAVLIGGFLTLWFLLGHSGATHEHQSAVGSSFPKARKGVARASHNLVPASYRCSGCPPPATGSLLAQDLRLARNAELELADLGPGWHEVGPAPKAGSDRPLGLESPKAAQGFVACLQLADPARADVLRNADQVLNLGSPEFSHGNGPSAITVSSWVDVVRSQADARADWQVYAASNFMHCESLLFEKLLGTADKSGTRLSKTSSASLPSAPVVVERTMVELPPSAHGAVLTLHTPDGTRYLGLLVVKRVETTLSLEGGPSGGAKSFLEHLLYRMASKEIGATA